MAGTEGPDETGSKAPGGARQAEAGGDDLEQRSRALREALAAKRPARDSEERRAPTGGMAGFGQAMKLSSEFIAGVAV